MALRSSFFPKEALQGEDLPFHVTWSNLEFDCIKIVHPKAFSPKEIYNVSKEDVTTGEGTVNIGRVQVDGYLGMVFSSETLPDRASDEKLDCLFLAKDDIVERVMFTVHLFRPDVVVIEVPKEVSIDPTSGEVTPKILVRNFGEGTAIVDIETTHESHLQKQPPEFVKVFVEEYVRNIKGSFAELRSDFAEYASILDRFEAYLLEPVKFEEQSLQEYQEFEHDLVSALEANEEFADALISVVIETFLRNSEFLNLYQFLLDYINSIGKEKIVVRDPLYVIKLSAEPIELQVRLNCIDLLKQMCTFQTLPPISIHSKQTGEIALFKLFQWGGFKE